MITKTVNGSNDVRKHSKRFVFWVVAYDDEDHDDAGLGWNRVKRKRLSGQTAPKPGEGRRGVEGHIGYLLRQSAAAYRLRLERALTSLCVTPPQFSILMMLKSYPGCSNAEIARIALLTPPTVTVIVKNLEKVGLVTKRAHAEHGRIQHIDITSRGQQLLAQCRAEAVAIEKELLSELTEHQEQIVKRWLVDVATGVQTDHLEED